jgi:hypothetical protein
MTIIAMGVGTMLSEMIESIGKMRSMRSMRMKVLYGRETRLPPL